MFSCIALGGLKPLPLKRFLKLENGYERIAADLVPDGKFELLFLLGALYHLWLGDYFNRTMSPARVNPQAGESMDPVTAITLKAANDVSEVAKEGAKGFISAVLHEPGEALGGLIADFIKERRHANLINIAVRSKQRLDDAGVSPKAVPLSIIHPALEAASLEEDLNLQEIWANLLANAADPRDINPVTPSFPAILKELSAREVKLLDTLFQEVRDEMQPRRQTDQAGVGFTDTQLMIAFSKAGLARYRATQSVPLVPRSIFAPVEPNEELIADGQELSLCMDALRRQELVIQNIGMNEKKDKIKGTTQGISYTLPNNTYSLTRTYSFTRLGIAFVNACRPPEAD